MSWREHPVQIDPLHHQRQGRRADGGRAGVPDGHAPQRLPADQREEGLRGRRMRGLQCPHRWGVLQLLPVSGRLGGREEHPHPGGPAGSRGGAQ